MDIDTWLKIAAMAGSALAFLLGITWRISKMESSINMQLQKTSSRLDNVQNTLGPYGSDIEKLKVAQSDLKTAQARMGADLNNQISNTTRLEGLIGDLNAKIK